MAETVDPSVGVRNPPAIPPTQTPEEQAAAKKKAAEIETAEKAVKAAATETKKKEDAKAAALKKEPLKTFSKSLGECEKLTDAKAKSDCVKAAEDKLKAAPGGKKALEQFTKLSEEVSKAKKSQEDLQKAVDTLKGPATPPPPPAAQKDTEAAAAAVLNVQKENEKSKANAQESQKQSRKEAGLQYLVQNEPVPDGQIPPEWETLSQEDLEAKGITRTLTEDGNSYTQKKYYEIGDDGAPKGEGSATKPDDLGSQEPTLHKTEGGDLLFTGLDSTNRGKSVDDEVLQNERNRVIDNLDVQTFTIPWDNRLGNAYSNTQSIGNHMPFGAEWVGSPSLMNRHALIRFNHVANGKHHTNLLDRPGQTAFRTDILKNYIKMENIRGASAETLSALESDRNVLVSSSNGDKHTKGVNVSKDEQFRKTYGIPDNLNGADGKPVQDVMIKQDEGGSLYYEEADTSIFLYEPTVDGKPVTWKKLKEEPGTGETFENNPIVVKAVMRTEEPTEEHVPAASLQELYGSTEVPILDMKYWADKQGLAEDGGSAAAAPPATPSNTQNKQDLETKKKALETERAGLFAAGKAPGETVDWTKDPKTLGIPDDKHKRYTEIQAELAKVDQDLAAANAGTQAPATPSGGKKLQAGNVGEVAKSYMWKPGTGKPSTIDDENYKQASNQINGALAVAAAAESRVWKLKNPRHPINKKYISDPKAPTIQMQEQDPDMIHIVEASRLPGREHFRYDPQDFIYLKEYDSIANNHLITLRRYPVPVFDNGKTFDQDNSRQYLDAISTMVTYFGEPTGNTLSELLNLNWALKWKDTPAQVHEVQGNEQGAEDGPAGGLAKFLGVITGEATFGSISGWDEQRAKFDPYKDGMYNNRIYGPVNAITTTKQRDQGLEFSHDVSVNFNYVLRSFGGVNAKAAALDILANALAMTYNNANFWGGANRYFPNKPQYPFLGGKRGMKAWYNGDVTGFIDAVGDQMLSAVKSLATMLESLFSDPLSALKGIASGGAKLWMAKKQHTRRPQILQFKALLTGDPIGEWHLTIGNPFNPIAMMGNMVCTGASVKFGEQLGLDDFPTEMTITIKLAHGKPRDKGDIESMFNRGNGRLHYAYFGQAAEAWNNASSTKDSRIDNSWGSGGGNTQQNPDGYNGGNRGRGLADGKSSGASTSRSSRGIYFFDGNPRDVDNAYRTTQRVFGGINKQAVDLAQKVGFRSGS